MSNTVHTVSFARTDEDDLRRVIESVVQEDLRHKLERHPLQRVYEKVMKQRKLSESLGYPLRMALFDEVLLMIGEEEARGLPESTLPRGLKGLDSAYLGGHPIHLFEWDGTLDHAHAVLPLLGVKWFSVASGQLRFPARSDNGSIPAGGWLLMFNEVIIHHGWSPLSEDLVLLDQDHGSEVPSEADMARAAHACGREVIDPANFPR